jgi:hypothetical protein
MSVERNFPSSPLVTFSLPRFKRLYLPPVKSIIANEHQAFLARFYELLKATNQPVISEFDKAGMILFDELADVRQLFAVDSRFTSYSIPM